MLVKVYVTGGGSALVFSDADNVDITPTGYLRISSSGSKDRPMTLQVGGVAANVWTSYEVLNDASVVTGDDTTNSGATTP